jgi:hypothetical protein
VSVVAVSGAQCCRRRLICLCRNAPRLRADKTIVRRWRGDPEGLTREQEGAWWAEEIPRRNQIALEREWRQRERDSQWFMGATFRFGGRLERREQWERSRCGAKTRRDGHPCWWEPEPGKKRCKFHGGKSTGPKTAEGRARISAAQKARWAKNGMRPRPILDDSRQGTRHDQA